MSLVRVRVDGVEKNLSGVVAKRAKSVEVLDEPTTNPDGSLRRTTRTGGRAMKPRTTVKKAAAQKATATKQAAAKQASGDAGNEGVNS